jgi:putative SOS response-associated peptidase YedK
MCNDYGNEIPYRAYLEAFSQIHIPVRFAVAAPNLEPRADIWPTEVAPVIRQVDDGVEFTNCAGASRRVDPRVRRSLISAPRGGGSRRDGASFLPPISSSSLAPNLRIEMEIHEGRRRMVLLCRPVAADAGWGRGAFTLLTTEPGPDVAPIHDRQVIVLERADWKPWLDLEQEEAQLLRPLPAGSLTVEEQVR